MATTVRRPVPRNGPRAPRAVTDNFLVSPSGLLHMGGGAERVTVTGLVLERTRCGRWIGSKVFGPGDRPLCEKCFAPVHAAP
jgi:hypothetical protein